MMIHTLDPTHPLRNAKLAEINAEYRQCGTKTWFPITPAFGIAKKTYNELGEVWTKNHEWQSTL